MTFAPSDRNGSTPAPLLVLFCVGMLALAPGCSQTGTPEKPYEAEWSSLRQHAFPEWLHDAKFGLWMHWGVFSVPAKHAWYTRKVFVEPEFRKFHEKTYGPLEEVGYHDLVPKFTAGRFDADRWATLFKQSGARYAGPLAEHHDGFAMYDSRFGRWDAAARGPQRDVLGALATSIRERDMKFVTSFHHTRNWWFLEPSYTADDRYETRDPRYAGLDKLYAPPHEKGEYAPKSYFSRKMQEVREVIDRYQPALLFFDTGPEALHNPNGQWYEDGAYEPVFRETVAYYYNRAASWTEDVAIIAEEGDLKGDLTKDVGVLSLERSRIDSIPDTPWMMLATIDNNGWSYMRDPDYKSTLDLLQLLVDVVSKNGVLWLNLGPRADGTIPDAQKQRIRALGTWLDRNGEAVYGTRPWRTAGTGSVRFTWKEDTLYAITFTKPFREWTTDVIRKEEAEKVTSVRLLGGASSLSFDHEDGTFSVEVPEGAEDQLAYVFAITM